MSNATISVANVENCHHSTRLLAQVLILIIITMVIIFASNRSPFLIIISIFQTSLRNILGTKNLHEILSDRESIALAMQVAEMIWKDDVGDQCLIYRRIDFGNFFQFEFVSLLRLIFLYLYLYLQGILDDATVAWGIKVERVEMWAIDVCLHDNRFLMSLKIQPPLIS